MNEVITMSDGFNFFEVTNEQALKIHQSESFDLYAVFEDDTESLLESLDEIIEAFENKIPVCIEIGMSTKKQKDYWWKSAEKQLINGYWWVKVSDIKLG